MPREQEGFREQLESIITMFPNGELLSVSDVARYSGRSDEYVTRHFEFNGSGRGQYITRTQLARAVLPRRTR